MDIKVLDTTLRDGEQTPGVSLTSLEKLRIANKLDEIGVDFIEAGSAITSEGERESIKEITRQGFNAEILSFSRPLTVDIDYCLDCDVDAVNLVVPTSDLHIRDKLNSTRENLIDLSNDAIDYCNDHGLVVELSAEEKAALIAKDSRYGNVICRCETITEGQICDAINRTLGARTLDGVKRRVRAGMGRCQGGFCSPRVIEIIARELGISPEEVRKNDEGSEMLKGFVR